ncbi:MAG: hypothetical protein HY736_04575 [Verrucomicrobia bacterium]|nr:hypothetical protein [Verrucomicrobiota bacterium]
METLRTASPNAIAPCGPECRFAQNLPAGIGDWIWCARVSSPRSTGTSAAECPWFSPRRSLAWPRTGFVADGKVPPPAE